MRFKKVFPLSVLACFLISSSLAFAVEPTTFPDKNKPRAIVPDGGADKTTVIKTQQRSTGTPTKSTNKTGKLVEPTLTPKIPPKTKY